LLDMLHALKFRFLFRLKSELTILGILFKGQHRHI
jgi:hypothetical protein